MGLSGVLTIGLAILTLYRSVTHERTGRQTHILRQHNTALYA